MSEFELDRIEYLRGVKIDKKYSPTRQPANRDYCIDIENHCDLGSVQTTGGGRIVGSASFSAIFS